MGPPQGIISPQAREGRTQERPLTCLRSPSYWPTTGVRRKTRPAAPGTNSAQAYRGQQSHLLLLAQNSLRLGDSEAAPGRAPAARKATAIKHTSLIELPAPFPQGVKVNRG